MKTDSLDTKKEEPVWDELRHALNLIENRIGAMDNYNDCGTSELKESWNLISDFITKNEAASQSIPEKTAEEILKEKLKNIHFIRSNETYALVIQAMEEYAAQFKGNLSPHNQEKNNQDNG